MTSLLMLLATLGPPPPVGTAPPVIPPPVVAKPGDEHPGLKETLDLLDIDCVQALKPDLSAGERARLALEIRAQGARLPGLTDGQPLPVQKLALGVEQGTARLFAALGRNDRDAVARETGTLATQLSALRAAMASP